LRQRTMFLLSEAQPKNVIVTPHPNLKMIANARNC
jgi:hypothetical protein